MMYSLNSTTISTLYQNQSVLPEPLVQYQIHGKTKLVKTMNPEKSKKASNGLDYLNNHRVDIRL